MQNIVLGFFIGFDFKGQNNNYRDNPLFYAGILNVVRLKMLSFC